MAVYIKLGKAWGVGLPWWVAMWALPFWLIYASFVLGWNILLFTWFALVWTWKAIEWTYNEVSQDIQKIKARK